MLLYLLLVLSVIVIVVLAYKFRKSTTSVTKPESSDLNVKHHQLLYREVLFYRNLDDMERKVFLNKVDRFLQKVRIEGVGTSVEDKDRVLVAASAIIPIFHFGNWMYKNITSVILYPDTFNEEFQFEDGSRNIMGMVGNGYMNGQMILSKTALHNGFKEPGGASNTAIHEFVHLLDGADGSIDGIPELLLNNASTIPWLKAIEKGVQDIEKGRSDMNPYAITNEAEFLAVAAEYFFEKPAKFKEKHPYLYAVMEKMFNPENSGG